jgi:N-glycosylase/DNA lyase
MIEKLCLNYGEKLMDDYEFGPIHNFPNANALAMPKVEQELRVLGFGYRAKFIQQSAAFIEAQEATWLSGLRLREDPDVHSELLKLPGVGPKVADCVALFSLDQAGAIPVDTHVYQIAAKNYLKHLKGKKSVTPKMYLEIGEFFRNRFGEKAGWAHSVLFAADLKMFKEVFDS